MGNIYLFIVIPQGLEFDYEPVHSNIMLKMKWCGYMNTDIYTF